MRGTHSRLYVPKGAIPSSTGKLSETSADILRMLSSGLTNEEMLALNPSLSESDIALAAKEALRLNFVAQTHQERLSKIVQRYPRAYDKWSPDEEQRVAELYKEGKTLREIAAVVERQPNAIRSRLEKMGMFT